MNELGTLLSYYLNEDDARVAFRMLRRRRFRHMALVHKSNDGRVRIKGRSRQQWIFQCVGIGTLVGLIIGVFAILIGRQTLGLMLVPTVLLPGLAGGFLGLLLALRFRLGVEEEILDKHKRWLMPDESVVVIQAPPSSMTWAIPVLRKSGGSQPSIFAFQADVDFEEDGDHRHSFPLPAAQIEKHAQRLATEHVVDRQRGRRGETLLHDLKRSESIIQQVSETLSEYNKLEQSLTPSAEWLLDNAYIIEAHIRDVRRNLPKGFYHELPILADGPLKWEPRLYSLASELILHTDGNLDRSNILSFLNAYQSVSTLTIGELWAMPLMLRIALIDRLRNLSLQVDRRFREGEVADFWANRLLVTARRDPNQLFTILSELTNEHPNPSAYFASQLTGHLYDEQTALVPAKSWLERSLHSGLGEITLEEQGQQASIQISIGNAISSLRHLSLMDWREIFEQISSVEQILRKDPSGNYSGMDFETRDRYRQAVEDIARGAVVTEESVASLVVELAEKVDRRVDNMHERHVGYYLIDEGRRDLIDQVGGHETIKQRLLHWVYRHHTLVYLTAITFFTSIFLSVPISAVAFGGEAGIVIFLAGIVALIPASQVATQFVNYLVTRLLPPRTLPKMSFEEIGIPDAFRTLVIVPFLLVDKQTIHEEVNKLEIRYLANPQKNLLFGLFSDFTDAEQWTLERDHELVKLAVDKIEKLNTRYGANRFYLFHRNREWSDSEGKFIGWERKRGKLEELNSLLDGEPSNRNGGILRVGDIRLLENVRFVLTLDSDTQLPRDSARRLIETLAHPLNLPDIHSSDGLPNGRYTVIQPRVSTALPSATATPFSKLFTDPVGVDPYTRAVSDVYQDLAGEGSYIGKGLYDPRSFNRKLSDRFPDQRILSHDLIEGAHVRVALASDIELYDEFPQDYLTYARRQHRWIRGDWQIADWILPYVPSRNGKRTPNRLSILNRWKIIDNLRRSLVPISLVTFLASGWLYSPTVGALASILAGFLILFLPLVQPVTWFTTPGGVGIFTLSELWHSVMRSVADAALIPHQAGLALDAILRVWYRRLISRKGFLEWTTVQMSGWKAASQMRSFLLTQVLVSILSFAIGLALWLFQPRSLIAAAPFLSLWFVSPLIVWRLNTVPRQDVHEDALSKKDRAELRQLTRQTWRYFDDFVGPDTHWLPPDNYQVSHQDELALRTSPTNIGLWMLSALGAHDFGYLTGDQTIERVDHTMETLHKVDRYEGHLLNWYDIRTLEPLEPRYVSMVDSGNFLGSLWTLEAGLKELNEEPLIGPRTFQGLRDTVSVLRNALSDANRLSPHVQPLDLLSRLFKDHPQTLDEMIGRLRAAISPAATLAHQLGLGTAIQDEPAYWAVKLEQDLTSWVTIIDRYLRWAEFLSVEPIETLTVMGEGSVQARKRLFERAPSLRELAQESVHHVKVILDAARDVEELPPHLKKMLDRFETAFSESRSSAREKFAQSERLVERIRAFSSEVNMRFLYDPERRLFSIGFNVTHQQLDGSFYDLLASEARLGSFIAIARGDVPNEHWLALNRPYGTTNRRRVLLSWTGTMFEYLMPLLMQRTFENSLLDNASHQAVALQQKYGAQRGVPWGISESAFGDLDINKTYQYKAFGVPGLGLKRSLEEDLVIAPYATMLALMVDPSAAVANLKTLEKQGLRGRYGFYEAVDYTRQRRREGERGVIVRAYMAHHQAMGFLAMLNLLHENVMQRRFHADPRVQANEPLLYERIPVSPPVYNMSTREGLASHTASEVAPSVSRFDTPNTPTPKTQLLSNGRFGLMITNSGGGYSHWKGIDLTRWQADTTRDNWGSFAYIRDLDSGRVWSNTSQPIGGELEDYAVRFAVDRAEFRRRDNGIETETQVVVSPEDDTEIRRITLINKTNHTRHLELTSYLELALAPHNADQQHPAFNKLFIQTEAQPQDGALLAYRRPRDEDDPPIFVAHRITVEGADEGEFQFETDRMQFIGRGRSPQNVISLRRELSNSAGYVLDPIFSIRKTLTLRPRQRLSLALVFSAADSRDDVLMQMEKYSDLRSINRSLELAWVHAQLELRLLRIQPDDARRFQKLASYLLYPNTRLRPTFERLEQNKLGQSRLWAHGISGDLPIVVVSIGEARDLGLVRQVLQAHTYWRQHGLNSDLVIINEEASAYEQPLHERLSRLIDAHSIYNSNDQPGSVFLLSMDQLPEEELTLILSVARVALVAARGPLSQQLGAPIKSVELPEELNQNRIPEDPSAPLKFMDLSYFNGLGGFTHDGKEYVMYLGPGENTPAPWVNVIANPEFGTLVTESGSGFVWNGNSQQNRLIGWSNDPVSDSASEAIYIRDEDSGVYWTPTPLPIRELDAYRIRHGAGYSVFEHNSHAIEQELLTFVPMDDAGGEPVRIQRLRLRNDSPRTRRLTVTYYAELALGDRRENTQMHVSTKWDTNARALLARNRYHPDYGERITFTAMSPAAEEYSGERTAFIGRNGSLAKPSAMQRVGLSGRTGSGLDPSAAMRVHLELEPGQTALVNIMLGQVETLDEVHRLVNKYREDLQVEETLQRSKGWWDKLLGRVQVSLPDPSAALLLNRWLLYQTLSCRIWGRSAFYQSGGAFGYRDQLQDVMALVYAAPELAREHILLAASRQFREGDVQHWWHPPSGAGIRSRISDDLLWLPYAVAQYVQVTDDVEILNEQIPFLEANLLEEDEHEIYLVPDQSAEEATLFEHCRRAIERGLTSGPHGLPLIGIGDWNDGMNRVGVEGTGESVWLAWFLVYVLNAFADLAERVGETDYAENARERAKRLAETVESVAWDGAWYRRATFDDGTPLGSSENEEAYIDSLPQTWAWISGGADPERSKQALESAWKELVREEDRLVLLFTPPFDNSNKNPGYIKGYPPGVRENGGQYTHGALWMAIALARMGDGDRAAQLLNLLNPIEHARDPEEVQRYAVEPYVVAADVYRLPGRVGRGGWTWYTGSAGWMYRAWVEDVLGLRLQNGHLHIDPVIPAEWNEFEIRYRQGEALYEIKVENPEGVNQGVATIEMDGRTLESPIIPLESNPIKHKVRVVLGNHQDQ
jgi:cyclic beta-1,2-glucan synthetase